MGRQRNVEVVKPRERALKHSAQSHRSMMSRISTLYVILVCLVATTVVRSAAPEATTRHHDMHTGHHDHMDHDKGGNHDMDGMDMGGKDMDHKHHGNDTGDMHMMEMYFHFGVDEFVLFKGWKITTAGGMIASVVGIFLMGMLYEGLKYFREYLFKQYVSSIQFSTIAITGEAGKVAQVHKVENHKMLSLAHGMQTALHIVQIIVSYFLMLIFMTYNVWLCLAVVLGSGVGYFIFGWRKASVVDITEHCH